jgi:hypothetical protein
MDLISELVAGKYFGLLFVPFRNGGPVQQSGLSFQAAAAVCSLAAMNPMRKGSLLESLINALFPVIRG